MIPERRGYINRSIITIDDAQTFIVDDARKRVLNLDWMHFGLTTQMVACSFEIAYPYALATCALTEKALPLFILNSENPEQAEVLSKLNSEKRVQIENGPYWLSLLENLSPDWATFIRDYLWTKTPEVIATLNRIEPNTLNGYFLNKHGEFIGMINRYVTLCEKLGIPSPGQSY